MALAKVSRTLNHDGIGAKEGRDLRPRFVKSLTDHP
jgi:hypothetical protein